MNEIQLENFFQMHRKYFTTITTLQTDFKRTENSCWSALWFFIFIFYSWCENSWCALTLMKKLSILNEERFLFQWQFSQSSILQNLAAELCSLCFRTL